MEHNWTTKVFLLFEIRLELKLELTQLSQIRLELQLSDFLKPEIELKFELELHLFKSKHL